MTDLRHYDKACANCRAYTRTQTGPHEWAHTCDLRRDCFPLAQHCQDYRPPPKPLSHPCPWLGDAEEDAL